MRKPIIKGRLDENKQYFYSAFTEYNSDMKIDDAASVECQKNARTEQSNKPIEYREILNAQKFNTGPALKEESRYHMKLLFDTPEKVEREYTGVCLGRRDHQFILIDKGTHYDAISLSEFVTFSVHIPLTGIQGRAPGSILVAASTGDIKTIEKSLAEHLKKDQKMDQRAQSFSKRMLSATDLAGTYLYDQNKKDMAYETDSNVIQNSYNKNKKKKHLAKMRQKVKGDWKDEKDDWGTSALNVGNIKKSEHDWDFEEGENATDDEEFVADPEEIVDDADQYIGEEVADSSDSEASEPLDTGGQSIKDALINAIELEADAELAQFSDDLEDSDQITEPGVQQQPQPVIAPPVEVEKIKHTAAPVDPLQQRIIGAMHRNSNIMRTKEFMAKFVKGKSTKDPAFIQLQKMIRDLCDIVSRRDPETGATSNYLKLKPKYQC